MEHTEMLMEETRIIQKEDKSTGSMTIFQKRNQQMKCLLCCIKIEETSQQEIKPEFNHFTFSMVFQLSRFRSFFENIFSSTQSR